MTSTTEGSGGGALARLREATSAAHRALEARLDVVETLGRAETRPGLVARYRRFHGVARALLRDWPVADARSWLDEPARHPTGNAVSGNAADGNDPAPFAAFAPRNAAEAAGFRYVIEGSALGGRVILKTLRARGVDTAELGFLDPWGERAGAGWRALVAVIERTLDTEDALRGGAAGAGKGFDFAERVLCEPLALPFALEPAA